MTDRCFAFNATLIEDGIFKAHLNPKFRKKITSAELAEWKA